MSSPQNSPRRVVLTGLGLISPLGLTTDALWQALCAGLSGVVAVPPELGRLAVPFAAPARDFTGEIDDFGPLAGEQKKSVKKGLKLMCRESQMGVAAAQRALAAAGIAPASLDPERCGVEFGSDYMLTKPDDFQEGIESCVNGSHAFEFARWAQEGLPKLSPLWLLKYLPNMPASHIAIYNDFRGPNNSLTLREAAGNLAVGEALRIIARDHAEVMVAGATGTRVHPMKAVHAVLQEEVALEGDDPAAACRPFDRDRTGMVLGEGAGAVVLEELDHARRRGASILGEVLGMGSSCVAGRDRVAHREQALVLAMRGALADAGLSPTDVGHVQAHGLATRSCDQEEARALAAVFGDRLAALPVTGAKQRRGRVDCGRARSERGAPVSDAKLPHARPGLSFADSARPRHARRRQFSESERHPARSGKLLAGGSVGGLG